MGKAEDYFEQAQEYLDQAGAGRTFTDEAKRASDIINGHLIAQPAAVRRWAAIRLSDGGSDSTLYDTKADAIRHQLDEFLCFYVCIPPTGTSPKEMQIMIDMHRAMYDKGLRMPDPDAPGGGPQWIRPAMNETLRGQQNAFGVLRNSSRWNRG